MIETRVAELTRDRTPFVVARVVRAVRPTSVRPGDSAIVHADGTIEGFVGGQCAEGSVRRYSARALETDTAVLLRLVPGEVAADEERDGVVVSHNPCLSGGELEIFLEPRAPAARLVVVGDTPVARALETIGRAAGYAVARGADLEPHADDAALVVASHGTDDEAAALTAALKAGVAYVGLVASEVRGTAVRASLDVADHLRAALRTPVGLPIGARSPADIAIAILAELVSEREAHHVLPTQSGTAIDPVCGMEVDTGPGAITADVDGTRFFFCRTGCRDAYLAEHG